MPCTWLIWLPKNLSPLGVISEHRVRYKLGAILGMIQNPPEHPFVHIDHL